jgi:hypothetical protein
MNMQFKSSLVATLIAAILFSQPVGAVDPNNLSDTEFKDRWGQVIYCQTIYKMPEVKSRLYEFDFEQCNVAGQLALELLNRYPSEAQAGLRFQAEKHATAISYNTSEPYQAVPACREYCRKLSEYVANRQPETNQEVESGNE